jgi:ADP-heptose:LPS heptosyltransferase
MKILLISYTRIGDTILSTGLIEHLLSKYENASFSVITSPFSASIYEDMPRLNKLIIVGKKKYSLHWFKIWNETRKTSWDLVIDLRSSLLSYFIRTKKRLIFKGNEKRHKLKQLQSFIGSERDLKLTIWANETKYLDIKDKKKLDDKYICIAPISNSPAKDWSINKYLELLANDLFNNFQIVLLGATTQKNSLININYLMKESKQPINNLINNADMIETFFILKKATLFLGSDSSNMHLAVTANIPTIGLFGPTDEKLYGPQGKNNLSLRGDKSFSEIVNQLDYKSGKIKSYLDDLSVTKVNKEIEKALYNK